jgi:hypothetical protein
MYDFYSLLVICLSFILNCHGQWSTSFVWDVLTSNSLATLNIGAGDDISSSFVVVQLDQGSSGFAFGTAGVHPTTNGVDPLSPLPVGNDASFQIIPNSQVNQSYGSGGFHAAMATGLLKVNNDVINVTFEAIETYDPPFPMGGSMNDIGIIGLCWQANQQPPPYCINGAEISTNQYGMTCNPSSDAVTNIPFLQQLKVMIIIFFDNFEYNMK